MRGEIIFITFICIIFLFTVISIISSSKKVKKIPSLEVDVIVKGENDLFELHYTREVWKGMKVLVEDTKQKYILTSIDFNKQNSWDLWKKYKDCKDTPRVSLAESYVFLESNGKETKDYLVLASGDNFEHRNIFDGNVLGIDRARFPKIKDIILDTDFVLWEVTNKKINCGINVYELTRADNRYKIAKDTDIFGVVKNCWNTKRV